MAASLKSQSVEKISEVEPPPPYEYHAPQQARSLLATPSHSSHAVAAVYSNSSSLRPIVIPQVTKAFGGAFASPFARAYAPALEQHGISELDFVTFIDGLNEAFVANPALQGVGIIGGMLGFVPIGTVQLVSVGVSVASGFVSAGVSYGRARAFVKDANAKIFLPKGLKVTVKTTKDMMAAVHADGGRLQLPPLEEFEATPEEMDAIAANDRLSDQTQSR